MDLTFDAEIWLWREGPWHFVTVPRWPALEDRAEERASGFGSVKVLVTLAASTWSTSVFPSEEAFILPVKKPIRRAAGVEAGDTVRITLSLP